MVDRYGDVVVGMVAKMRLLSSRVLKGRIDIVMYCMSLSLLEMKKERENKQVMSNNFYGEGPDSTRIPAEVVSSDPINVSGFNFYLRRRSKARRGRLTSILI